jgi:hypothetical protein
MPRFVLARITLMVAAAVILMSAQARADAAADSIPGTASASPAGSSNAGSVTATTPLPALREIRAVRLTSPVSIDGVLSEPVWQQAEPVEAFIQRDPDENAPPTQRTVVRLAYDDAALYVAARMFDTAPDSIFSRLARRDVSIQSDQFTLYLDPYYDRRSGYYFMVNAAGTLYDGTLYNDNNDDSSWDGVWDGKAKIDREGWTMEMRIPYTQLRFAKTNVQRWGVNFRRTLMRRNEQDYVVIPPKKESGFVSRFPALVGIEGVSPGNAIELMPYAMSKAEYLRHSALDPFNDGSRYRPNVGGDLRMALGSKLTVNATVNPDFGQVEVDPAVVNLTDLETFFPEKRPFFVQGSSIFSAGKQGAGDYWGFNWSDPTFFYTRRIGRSIAESAAGDVEYADVPAAATILGAAKIAGKLSPSLNVGILQAVTDQERANVQLADLSRDHVVVEPLAYYGVTRVLKEFAERRNGLGLLGTLAARRLRDATENSFNRTGALGVVDGWHFIDKDKVWVLSGWAGLSRIDGTSARLTAIQRSSRHYFQRPDAKSYELDPSATSLMGGGGRVWLNKEKGSWFSNSALGFVSPGFEINDLGFQTRSDVINSHVGVGYRWTERTKARKSQDVTGAVFGNANFDGNITNAGVWLQGSTEFINNYSWVYSVAYNPEVVHPSRSRGGPLMLNAPGYEFYNYFDTDGKSKQFFYVESYLYNQPEENSYLWYLSPGFELKPISNLSFRVGPKFERARDGSFFVGSAANPAATGTFGRSYVFAQLDQKTLSADIRLNVTFSPTVSLQFYGQPLIATGEYNDYRELARAKSLDFIGPGSGPWTYDAATRTFDPDGPGSQQAFIPDFNSKSLIGNAVFRWEYMPGSAFYLVWTQERTDDESIPAFEFGPSFRRLVKAEANNVFLAKVTYYLGR